MEAHMSSRLTENAAHSSLARSPKSTNLIALVTQVIAAMRDGLNSMHHYEDLRAHGVSHVSAAKQACVFDA
jgi:hypothetical protein